MSDAFTQLLSGISPAVYDNFKRAVELGKWPDGREVTSEQRALCMEAMIVYEHKHMPPEQRSGYVPPKGGDCAPLVPQQSPGQVGQEQSPELMLIWKNQTNN